MKKLLFVLGLLGIAALAQESGVIVTAIVQPSWADKILALIPSSPANVSLAAFIMGGVIDVLIRVSKSQKPLDLMIVIARVAFGVGNICLKLSNLLDKVLPQRSIEPKQK